MPCQFLWKLRRPFNLSIGDEKLKLLCLFFIFDFMGHFWREMGVATTRAPNGLGPPDWVDLLGQLLPQNHVFEIFRPEKLYLEIMMWPLGGAVRWGR